MTHQIIHPRMLPLGLADSAIGLAVGILLYIAYLVVVSIPTLAVGILTQNALLAALVMLLMIVVVLPLAGLLCTVRHLRCDDEGVEFVRACGSPKKIPWAQVESVEEAPQAEVVRRGWLCLRFPPREATATLSSLGHYRIRWEGGTAYFPPKDVPRFLDAVRRGMAMSARR